MQEFLKFHFFSTLWLAKISKLGKIEIWTKFEISFFSGGEEGGLDPPIPLIKRLKLD